MRKADRIVSGRTVVLLDEEGTIINNGAVAVTGDCIAAVGTQSEIEAHYVSEETIDAGNGLVMPGLINGHTHAAMTCFRGIADDLPLMDWLNNYIFPAEAKNISPESVYWGSLLACAEMIRSGTTTFCDMYIFEEETAQAAKQAGMRCLLGEVLFDFPSPNYRTPEEGLAYAETMINKWAGDPLVRIIVEPHALYTCSPSLLRNAKALAERHGVPYALHLLENRAEEVRLRERFGKKATHFLREIGYLDDKLIAFHGVCLDDEDIRLFRDHGCKIVHNPESNMKLASGVAPVVEMLAAGLPVGLGTDGCASNNNLDMLQEMDTAAKLHKVFRLDPTVMPAEQVIRMATGIGARVLGLDAITGSLEPGKKADMIILNLDQPHLTPLYSEYSQVVYAACGADVRTVLINGRLVMHDRKLLTIDESEVMGKIREIARGIKRSLTNAAPAS